MKEVVLWAQANLHGVNVVGIHPPPSLSEALGVKEPHCVSGLKARFDLQLLPLFAHALGQRTYCLPTSVTSQGKRIPK